MSLGRKDVDHSTTASLPELNFAIDEGEQRVVSALADILAGMELRATLPDQDRPCCDGRTAESLHAEALGIRVTTVASGSSTFCLRHDSALRNGGDLDHLVMKG